MTIGQTDQDFIEQALPAFYSESQEQLTEFEQLLLRLETTTVDRELLDALFRCAHTIKGSASMFGLDAVAGFTHHVETLLDRLREGQLHLTAPLGTLLLQANDQIATLVRRAVEAGIEDAQGTAVREALVARLQSAGGTSNEAPAPAPLQQPSPRMEDTGPPPRWRVSARFGADTFRNGMDPIALLDNLRQMGEVSELVCDTTLISLLPALDPETCELGFSFVFATADAHAGIEEAFAFVRDHCELSIELAEPRRKPVATTPGVVDVPEVPQPGARATPPTSPAEDVRFIRVQADRLDAVINLLGELVIAGAGASLIARQARHGALIEASQQVTRLIEEIRDSTLQLRMVPIGETFSRFRRVVRDAAASLGKEVALEVLGGDTELDKSMVERIADPLMHLVRNALDHGLEQPDERERGGKPAQGRLALHARHEAGSVLIRIEDDGRGIDTGKVLRRARERGLVDPAAVPGENEILALIFEPGFATAEQVTDLGGRGVGMDMVRRNIEALRGSVAIESKPGRGTAIEIRLPLTLAIIDGFLVGVGASRFIFPLDAVVEVIECVPSVPQALPASTSTVQIRGGLLPVVDLRRIYALESCAPERTSIVVVRSASRTFGVRVDTLLGQHQTVIRPLSRMLRGLQCISGSSILGTGEVALIFDPAALGFLSAATNRYPIPSARQAGEAPVPALNR